MNPKNRLMMLTALAAMCLICQSPAIAETINTQDYWVLNDGYSEDFTNNGQVSVSYGPYSPRITEDVFHVDWPGSTGTTHQFFNYDSGRLIYYGARYHDAQYGERWVYIPVSPQELLPAVLEVGKSYTKSWSRAEYKNGGYEGNGSDSYTITISGPRNTTVPGGTISTYEFRFVDDWRTSAGVTGTTIYTYYLARGIGWVKIIRDGVTYERVSPMPGFSVTPTQLNLIPSQTGTCAISGGTAPYTAVSSNTGVAVCDVSGSTLFVAGISGGTATITVTDSTAQSAWVNVTVTGPPAAPTLTVSTSGISAIFSWTPVANAAGYALYYAPAPYTGPDTIIGVDMGAKTSTSIDFREGDAYHCAVQAYNSVGSSPYSNILRFEIDSTALSVNPASLNLSPNETGTCTVSGGTGPYTAVSGNTSVALTEVSGSTVFVRGVQAGSATVTAWDSAGHSAGVSVTVSGGTPSTYTNSLGMTFILLSAGTFTMGSPSDEPGSYSNERPQHQVTLTRAFYMQNTEVTQAQWEAVMGSNPSHFSGCPSCPVEEVSWDVIQGFLDHMKARGEGAYNLPTEAQWEYAARAGSTTAFYNGGITETGSGYDSNLNAIGWYTYNSDSETHPVAQKAPNAWGLYDMSGNVWEWCRDWYDGSYYDWGLRTDPMGPSSGSYRVKRGGSWGGNAKNCRSANRNYSSPDYRYYNIGFRLMRQP